MSKNTRRNRQKEIDDIRKEIVENDKVYKRSKEEPDLSIHMGLMQDKVLNENSPFYVTLLDRLDFDLRELDLIIPTEMRVINPTYEYQKNPEWQKLCLDAYARKRKAVKDSLSNLNDGISKVKERIAEQQSRWEDRRKLLINRLKEIGCDTSDFEKPDYIG